MMMQPVLSSAATVAVDKATSEFLNAPDWTLNIHICDSLNSNHWKRKDTVKAVKRRLQHSSSRVQLLALTLLETMMNNCGDYVHYQIDERNILGEMLKIVKRKFVKADIRVRDKILVLLESWQEAFGGRKGEHPQYYWAYQELRRAGVSFPERSPNAVHILTPPAKHHHTGYGVPRDSLTRLGETIATQTERVSFSSLDSIKDVMDLLGDMLQAVNPRDPTAVKDDLIVDLVNQCRSNQKKLMQTLTTTGNEKLLGRGLELNDGLQSLLAKYDAIASGSPLATQFTTSVSSKPTEANTVDKSNQVKNSSPTSNIIPPASVPIVRSSLIGDHDEEEDEDFAQLTRRHSRAESRSSQSTSAAGTYESLMPINDTIVATSYEPTDSATGDLCKVLALPSDSATQVKNTKEQDMIDLLSLTLSDSSPSTNHQNMHHQVQQPPSEGYTQCQGRPEGPMPYDSYIVPWAQPQVQPRFIGQPQFQSQSQTFLEPQYSSGYPLPQWTNTPGYFTGQNQVSSANNNMFSTQKLNADSSNTMIGKRPLQHSSSYPMIGGSSGTTMNGDYFRTPVLAQKPYIPPYRLFEDLNVVENGGGRLKMKSSASTQSMVGLRK